MSEQENSSTWTLNLDLAAAKEGLENFQEGLNAVGSTNFDELIETVTKIGTVIGVVGAAALALKESFNLVLEAEQIKAVEEQFDVLAKNAGLYGNTLKEALVESAGGLVDETTLLKGASEAMAGLGQNSAKLPEVMTLARQATQVFGGDLMTNFNGISQAIASGNTRMLKHLGIVVDQNKAYETYANSIGVATDELSKAGQQHAIMNAVLEKGKTAFAGIDVNVKEATNTWAQFKATMTDIGESITLAYAKIMGPTVIGALKLLSNTAKEASDFFKSHFGTGLEAASASVDGLTRKLADLRAKQAMLQAAPKGMYDPQLLENVNKEIDETNAKLGTQKAKLAEVKVEDDKNAAAAKANAASVTKESEIDLVKRNADLLKFQTNLDNLRTKNAAEEIKTATSITAFKKAELEKEADLVKQYVNSVQKIQQTQGVSQEQKNRMIAELDRQRSRQTTALRQQLIKDETTALDNLEKENADVATKFGNTWTAESGKARIAMNDFGQIAKKSFSMVQSASASAFEAMGDGSQSAGQAMQGAVFGALGGMAEAQGELMLGAGLWPPDPLVLAGGAGLLVLGGWLKGQAKGSTSAAPPAASGGGGSAAGATPAAAAATSTTGPTAAATAAPVPQTTIQIQGHMLMTDQTSQWLVQQIRAASDQTAFRIQVPGGGLGS